jgi:hypothetical protein
VCVDVYDQKGLSIKTGTRRQRKTPTRKIKLTRTMQVIE